MSSKLIAPASPAGEYWRLADMLKAFWTGVFAEFVKPLERVFSDPVSAGVHLVAAHVTDADGARAKFVSNPAAFGRLLSTVPSKAKLESSFLLLSVERPELTLATYAAMFNELRQASVQFALFAHRHPRLFEELQKQRAARGGGPTRTTVQFFGRQVEVPNTTSAKHPTKVKLVTSRMRKR